MSKKSSSLPDNNVVTLPSKRAIGSGPFAVESADAQSVRLAANPSHFAGRPYLHTLTLRAFPALRAETEGQDTLLRGAVADQAALHGVLSQVEALGLELLELRRNKTHERTTP